METGETPLSPRASAKVPRPGEAWTPLELIKVSAAYLAERGVGSPRLDAELLLAHVLQVPRLRLYLDFERPILEPELDRYRELIRRRGQRVPLQLLTGTAQLLEGAFQTRPGVFIPRPETETLIEVAQALFAADEEPAEPALLAEVGVGTGCIGILLLGHWPSTRLIGFDISAEAVALATANAQLHGVAPRARFVHGEAWGTASAEAAAGDAGDRGPFDLIVANPPYVPHDVIARLEPEVRDHDPVAALDGGDDGLAIIRALVTWARHALRPQGWIAFEHGHDQADACAALLCAAGFAAVAGHRDLGGYLRVSVARAPAR